MIRLINAKLIMSKLKRTTYSLKKLRRRSSSDNRLLLIQKIKNKFLLSLITIELRLLMEQLHQKVLKLI